MAESDSPIRISDAVAELQEFAKANSFKGRGPLSLALIITDRASDMKFPLQFSDFVTEGQGQVRGLGGGAIKKILDRHGITRRLAAEGGRTSRGSIARAEAYVRWLNEAHERNVLDLAAVERFWIERVNDFFASRPLRLRVDPANGLGAIVRDLLAQARERQREASGVMVVGAVMQHLVGAKLAMLELDVQHHSFETADAPSNRSGDFLVGDVAVHVTTAPSEALIGKCRANLDGSLRPMIVTVENGVAGARALADNADIADRIDIYDIAQFISLNLHEFGAFKAEASRQSTEAMFERYNQIVEQVESDPSLRIELG